MRIIRKYTNGLEDEHCKDKSDGYRLIDNTPINVNNVLIENIEGYVYSCDNATASRKRPRTKRYSEESWQAGRHMSNTVITSKATLPSA